MNSERRNTLPLKFKIPKVESLLSLAAKMTPIRQQNFSENYEGILRMVTTRVDASAMVALAQYYDPPLRCFTFQDYQLALTIEEFERILDCYLRDRMPFIDMGENASVEHIAEALFLVVRDVALLLKDKRISRKVLEAKALALEKEKNRKACGTILAILIYGTVLFPSEDDFISTSAINMFVIRNPSPTLLADVYYHLHVKHGKKKGLVLCCSVLLYTWLLSHMPREDPMVGVLKNLKWSQKLATLSADYVFWYSRKWEVDDLIFSCGDFLNVPLIRTQGCINYNPILSLRQHGYPMEKETEGRFLEEFILLDMGKEDPDMLRRIKRSWSNVHRKGK